MKFLKKFKTLFIILKNIFKLHYDNYVPYRWRDESLFYFLGLENIKIIRRARVKYWHKKSKEYPPFSPFFVESDLKEIQKNNSIVKEVKDIYESGSAIINNTLSESQIRLINDFAENLKLNSDNNFVQESLPESLNEIRESLIEKLYNIYKNFFPKSLANKKNLSDIYMGVRIDYSFDGIDSSPQTANWHVDRFLPTINAIYFPNGSDWGCFEKDIGSPLITSKDLDYYVNDQKKDKKTNEDIRDNLYVPFENRTKKKFILEKNTLYVGTHHMQHRRSPITSPGKRIAVFIDHYNFFTRKSLM